jgi:hypothetical protein
LLLFSACFFVASQIDPACGDFDNPLQTTCIQIDAALIASPQYQAVILSLGDKTKQTSSVLVFSFRLVSMGVA